MIRIRGLFMLGAMACISAARADSVYVSTTNGNLLSIDTATGTQSAFGPNLFAPSGLTVDGAGHLYVASNNDPSLSTRIVELSPAGNVIPSTYASTFVTLEGLASIGKATYTQAISLSAG